MKPSALVKGSELEERSLKRGFLVRRIMLLMDAYIMIVKDNCFSKMPMYLFNIYKESKNNDHITAILTCSDTNFDF